MLVVTELVSIVSEKVTETFDVIETEVSPSEGELDDTVGGVVSVVVVVSSSVVVVLSLVVDAPSSLLLLQEMKVKLKRNRERRMSRCFTWVPIGWFRRTQYITSIGLFYKNRGFYLEGCLTCEELVGVTHRR